MVLLMETNPDLLPTYLTRYTFQATVHSLWKERNERRHRDIPIPAVALAKMVDRQIRNKCLSLCQQGTFKLAVGLFLWFARR